MKKFLFFILPLLFTMPVLAQYDSDEVNIRKVIEGETLAFANADLKGWSDYFVHEPYVRWSVSPQMYFNGWDALYNGAKSFLETRSGHNDADALHKITRSDWNIHINGNVAWVKFVQTVEGAAVSSQQFRVLEKINDTWKISMLVAVQ
jgi:hypothetical protein